MAIEFNCRSCGKLLRTTDDNAGRRARCPDCGEPFVVPAAPPEPETYGIEFESNEPFSTPAPPFAPAAGPVATPPRPELKSSRAPSPPVEEILRPCPMCGTQVDRQTTRCPSCGEELRMDFSAGSQFASGNTLSFDRVYRQAWGAFTSQMGASVLGGFLVSLSLAVPSVLLYLLILAFDSGSRSDFSSFNSIRFGIQSAIALSLLSLGLVVLYLLWGTQICLGGSRYFLSLVRRQHAHTGQILDSNQYRRALGNGTVLMLLIAAICVVVGIFLPIFGVGTTSTSSYGRFDEFGEFESWDRPRMSAGDELAWDIAMSLVALLTFIPFSAMYFVLADQDAPRMMCLRLSREATKGNYFTLLLIFLSLIVLNAIGALALLIGLLFTIPLGFLILAAAYDQMTTTHAGDVA